MSCVVCLKKATVHYTNDLDIKGIGACDEHQEMVRNDIMFLFLDLTTWKKLEKKYKRIRKITKP
jgi:hypothetical protein